ncbi:NAD(P)/FAD-dependent oxidoreductase, partial [Planctomicrobium sp.]
MLKTRFISCECDQFSNSVKLQSEGRELEVSSKFVIGCDGAQSRVAKSLQLSENRKWIVGLERVYRSGESNSDSPKFHCLIDPVLAPGYIAWVVDDGEEIHVGVGGDAKRFNPKSALIEFESWAEQEINLTSGNLIEQRGGKIPVGGLLPNISNPYGILVGDAAGAVSPLTAGGLDPCLRMSRLAAILTNEYLNTGDEKVLQRYNGQQIRKRFWKRLILRRCLETIRSRTLINIGWSALNSPPGKAFARKIMFGRGSFPDLHPSNDRRSRGSDKINSDAYC